MSASLVGSEMCIRDSACVVWSRNSIARLRCWLLGGCELSDCVFFLDTTGCLLYTSDAADDM
eukprot:2577554-Alexandrium_andersonii.AAC.1